MAKKTRKFNGKIYTKIWENKSKSVAKRIVKQNNWKNKNSLIRIIKERTKGKWHTPKRYVYAVYYRKK